MRDGVAESTRTRHQPPEQHLADGVLGAAHRLQQGSVLTQMDAEDGCPRADARWPGTRAAVTANLGCQLDERTF